MSAKLDQYEIIVNLPMSRLERALDPRWASDMLEDGDTLQSEIDLSSSHNSESDILQDKSCTA